MSNNKGKWRNSSTGEVIPAPAGYYVGKTDESRWIVKGEGAGDDVVKSMQQEIEQEIMAGGDEG